ncbi:hypothetical protein COY90_02345, partial [Candidatus Roizmanbacteria bacterium CG_4_10_14_0_8_um_filter_39_9]
RINAFMFILLGLLLPTQLGKHFFLAFSYLLGVRIDYLAPTLYVTDCLVLMLIVWNYSAVFSLFKSKLTVVLLSISFISIFFATVPWIAFYKFAKIIEVVFLFFVCKRNRSYFPYLLGGIFVSTGFEFFLSLSQLIQKHALEGWWYFLGERPLNLSMPSVAKASFQGTQILRPYGTFSHPNSMGGFYLFLFFMVLTDGRIRNRIFKYVFFFLSTILIFISFSKATIGTFIVLYVIYSLKNAKACRICTAAKLLSLPLAALLFFSWQTDPLSLQKRFELITQSLIVIQKNALFGVGLGNYLVAQSHFPIKYPYFFLQPVHNIFLLIIAEVGLVFAVIFLIIAFRFALKHVRNPAFLFPVLVLCITGMVDHYWITLEQNIILLAVFFGFFDYTDRYGAKTKQIRGN